MLGRTQETIVTSRLDRRSGDVGNITRFEHINLRVPDRGLASMFYVSALGLTQDPYIDLGPDLLWFNVGRQQLHVPFSGERADVLRGTIVLRYANLASLEERLERVRDHFTGTPFGFAREDDAVHVTGPWGNRFRCIDGAAGTLMSSGLASVEFAVPHGTAPSIARFYSEAMGAPSCQSDGRCDVVVGARQTFAFVESDDVPDYDGHHVAIYVSNFSGPHSFLAERNLIAEETNEFQYRFNWIVDPDSGEEVFELEHEVRSLYHPLADRPLITKNPDQRLQGYVVGDDAR